MKRSSWRDHQTICFPTKFCSINQYKGCIFEQLIPVSPIVHKAYKIMKGVCTSISVFVDSSTLVIKLKSISNLVTNLILYSLTPKNQTPYKNKCHLFFLTYTNIKFTAIYIKEHCIITCKLQVVVIFNYKINVHFTFCMVYYFQFSYCTFW